VDVGNAGDRTGDEVVQLYIRDEVASVEQPVKSLQGFKRITLQPGQSMAVSFRLRPDALALYDQQMRRVVEPGWFSVFAGTNSDTTLATRFQVTGSTFVLSSPTPRFR
jgi:beta-glucosidase